MQHRPIQDKRPNVKLVQEKFYHDIISATIINNFCGWIPINVPIKKKKKKTTKTSARTSFVCGKGT